ncbi:hypothetical protein [Turicimonas muris]|jgi:hypothetical protein|uniref:Uncharacterized protein n=1 Tax=Siphoviridae sp. ctw757 TaxID=2827969 RepID=A0A8S5TC94_9CAUD|nr:hypothetical protein [Turicimonas muris]DAF60607.1 MAG TPA: hypothetical protein [Siphoviridae sp. ctw757]DAY90683.1 MAG TPA: hypothetical protein [Caudoviricetes sp.]
MDVQTFFTEKFPELKGKDKETQIAILEEEASRCGKFLREWQEFKKDIELKGGAQPLKNILLI